MTVKCNRCSKTWPNYDRFEVIIHYRANHQANLTFITNEELKKMVTEL